MKVIEILISAQCALLLSLIKTHALPLTTQESDPKFINNKDIHKILAALSVAHDIAWELEHQDTEDEQDTPKSQDNQDIHVLHDHHGHGNQESQESMIMDEVQHHNFPRPLANFFPQKLGHDKKGLRDTYDVWNVYDWDWYLTEFVKPRQSFKPFNPLDFKMIG